MSGSDEEKIHRTVERVARESPEVCADRTAEVSGAARRRGSPKTPQSIRPVLPAAEKRKPERAAASQDGPTARCEPIMSLHGFCARTRRETGELPRRSYASPSHPG
jgi:hypothetical protein